MFLCSPLQVRFCIPLSFFDFALAVDGLVGDPLFGDSTIAIDSYFNRICTYVQFLSTYIFEMDLLVRVEFTNCPRELLLTA